MSRPKFQAARKREIKKNPEVPDLTPELVDGLTRLCFAEKAKKPVDLLFVFGSNIEQQKLAAHIMKLLRAGISRKVILTGGVADYDMAHVSPVPESQQIFSHIAAEEFSGIHFIRETTSRNSLENVTEAGKIYDFRQDHSILFLSHSYASTRCRLTLKKICPDKEILAWPYDIAAGPGGHPVSRASWWRTPIGQSVVWGEFLRIVKYGDRGDFSTEEVRPQLDQILGMLTGEFLPAE
ncbi:MAG TPA: ElyC/SanA/YdcF family protein [Puia sp.]|nr:ElyC/SanA/YdcF family protein [Puia sp.]